MTPASHLSLLQPQRRKRVTAFVKRGTFPDPLEQEFIEAAQEILSGLIKVEVKTADLRAALLAGGSPASPVELKARFERYIDDQTIGHEALEVRVVPE